MTTSLPSARSPSVSAEHRAERVAVRVLVRDDEEAVVRADRIRDRFELTSSCVARLIVGRILGASGRSAASSSISFVMRTPRSTDSS